MDWQQLQSLYNQKKSVDHAGTLTPETITPSGSIRKTSTPKLRRMPLWVPILLMVLIFLIIGVFVWYKKLSPKARHIAQQQTTEVSPDELRQQMLDEIIASNQSSSLTPQVMHDILSGKQ